MKSLLYVVAAIVIVAGVVFLMGTDVDVKDSGALPEVSVNAEGGRLPDVDVNAPEVTVQTESTTVAIPKVELKTEDTEVKIARVDFNAAEDSVIDEANEPEALENE